MMMNDLISRQAAIDATHSTIFDFFDICEDDSDSPMTESDKRLLELNKAITTAIRRLPTIDLVRHGNWLKYPGALVSDDGLWGETLYDCSECGWTKHIATNFCPKCGANMVLDGEIQVRWKDAAD